MTSQRQQKVSSLLRDFAAAYIQREAGPESLITVTRVSVSPDLSNATLYITTLPTDMEEKARSFVEGRLGALREEIKPKLSIKTLPFLHVEIDKGERNRQRIDDLTREQ